MKPLLREGQLPLVRAIVQAIAPCSEYSGFLTGIDRSLPSSLPALIIESVDYAPWASATFVGATYALTLQLTAPLGNVAAAHTLLKSVADIDIVLPGHIVADIALKSVRRRRLPSGLVCARFMIEALTVED